VSVRLTAFIQGSRASRIVRYWILPLAAVLGVAYTADHYVQAIFTLILIASIGAMALTVLMGMAGQPSLLTAALLLIGGYSAALFDSYLKMPFLVTLITTFVIGTMVGVVASLPARRLTGLYLLLSTLAVHVIATDFGNALQTKAGALGGYFLKSPILFGHKISDSFDWVIFSGLAAFIVFHYLRYVSSTRVGRAWVLIREAGSGASKVVGVNAGRYVIYAFGLTSGITAVAGMLLAFYTHNVSYDGFDLLTAVGYIVMIVLGGVGSLPGAVIGAAFVTALPYVLQQLSGNGSGTDFLSANLSYLQSAIYGLIGILALVFVPSGLVGGVVRLRRLPKLVLGAARNGFGTGRRARARQVSKRQATDKSGVLVSLHDVSAEYGSGEIGLSDTSLDIPMDGAIAILGRNGSGKTTLLYSVVGFPPGSGGRVVSGDIKLNHEGRASSLLDMDTVSRVRRGIILVPAEDKVFKTLTVRDHLTEALASGGDRQGSLTDLDSILGRFPALKSRLDARASSLSGGERQQLALATALARHARLLLVDEASLGLAPVAIDTMIDILQQIKSERATTLVVVEQSPPLGFAIGDSVVLLDAGTIAAVGAPSPELQETIERTYLGVEKLVEQRPSFESVGAPDDLQSAASSVRPALELSGVSVVVGGVHALTKVSLAVPEGRSVGLIGANGAGKTSLLNVVCGYYRALEGKVRLAGEDITNLPSHRVIGKGVARTFQSPGQIVDLTVLDFVLLGFERRWSGPIVGSLVGDPRSLRAERDFRTEALELLRGSGLEAYSDVRLGQCPYGIRKLADIVRAVAGKSQVLLLDEPTSGMSAGDRPRIREFIRQHQQTSLATVLLVDHDVDFVSDLCAELVVLAAGRVIASGPKASVLANPEVIRTFVGRRDVKRSA
jgi:ABC-type branched-subunit amino acid transport system ATPase component/ABC-type branched-subunit amino acid transport system permease subunit